MNKKKKKYLIADTVLRKTKIYFFLKDGLIYTYPGNLIQPFKKQYRSPVSIFLQ